MSWIPIVTKVYRFLNERDRRADIEEVRKWFQPLFPHLRDIDKLLTSEEMDRLVRDALPEGRWQPAVALAQTLLLVGAGDDVTTTIDRIRKLLTVWEKKSLNYSALLSELRKRVLALGKPDPSIIETLDYDPNKPSYFSSEYSASGVDFFLNYLKFEEGVDVEGLVEPLRKMFEREQGVEEFLRLCGIDELIGTEEFLSRVEKAVDVLAKAKEQGLDVEEILKKWDELANGGGSRFVYLEEAVKAVADEEVGRRFWEEVEKVLGEEDLPVLVFDHHKDKNILVQAVSLGLARIEGVRVELTDEFRNILRNTVEILKKSSPSALYSLGDIVSLIRKFVLSDAASSREAELRSYVLSRLSPSSLRALLSDEASVRAIFDAMRRTVLRGFDPEKFVNAVEESLKEGGGKGLLASILENVHREEGA